MSGETKNPGAARFGNFINYYQFNPPENRLKFLPANLSSMVVGGKGQGQPMTVLDVGCNAGVSISMAILTYFLNPYRQTDLKCQKGKLNVC